LSTKPTDAEPDTEESCTELERDRGTADVDVPTGMRLWEAKPARWITERAAYLRRTTEFDETNCRIIAAAEIGYTNSWITKFVDVGRGTVKARMKQIDEQFDFEYDSALWTRRPGCIEIQSPVGIAGTAWRDDE
jgi:hypothetical protein